MLDTRVQQHIQEPQLGALQQESRFDTAASLLLQSVDTLGREIQLQGDSSEATSYIQVETTVVPDTGGRKDRVKTSYSIDQNGQEIISSLCDALDVSQLQTREEYEYLTVLLRELSRLLKSNLIDSDLHTQKIQKEWIKRATDGVRLRALSTLKKAEKSKLAKSDDHIQAETIKAEILRTSMLTLDGSESKWRDYSAELSFYYASHKAQNHPSEPDYQAKNAELRRIISIARNFGFQEHCAAMQKKTTPEPQKPLIGSVLRNHTKLRDVAVGAGLAVVGGLMISEATKDMAAAQEVESMYTEDAQNAQATLEAHADSEDEKPLHIPGMMSAQEHRNAPRIDYRTPGEVNISFNGKPLMRKNSNGSIEDGVTYLTSSDLEMPEILPAGQSLRINTRENIPIHIHHSILKNVPEIFNALVEIVREDRNGDGQYDDDPERLIGGRMDLGKDGVEESYVVVSAEIVDAWKTENGNPRTITTSDMLSIDSLAKVRLMNILGLEVHDTCYSFKSRLGENGKYMLVTDKNLIIGAVRVHPTQIQQPLRPHIQMARQEIQADIQEGKLSKLKRLLKPVDNARQWAAVRAQKRSKQTAN